MIYLEAYLLAIIAGLFAETSLSDIKKGIISNKSIVLALGAGIVCVICYYYFFAKEYISSYMINVGIGTVIGLLLYIFGIWGAGDSKLLMTTMILFPARIYCTDGRSVASCFVLISIVFIIAFAYTVIDTIYLGIKEKNLLVLPKKRTGNICREYCRTAWCVLYDHISL